MRKASFRLPRPRAAWLYAALGAVLLLLPLAAFARGGFGEHFSPGGGGGSVGGGSSGGGSSGGDGGILGDIIGFLLELVFSILWELTVRFPYVMVPLYIALAGWGAYKSYLKHREARATRATLKSLAEREADKRIKVSAQDENRWIQAVMKTDDTLTWLVQLKARAEKLFVALQEAWFKRDLTPVRPFLSDATYQRLEMQLKLLADQGVRDALTDIRVLEVQIIGLQQSQGFDTVHLRMSAAMRDTDVPATASDEQAREAARKVDADAFSEVWSFVRRQGTRTRTDLDVSQGQCPQCGAPFSGGATNSCEHCKAIVNSGNYDWTLAEITQLSVFSPGTTRVVGMEQMQETDPALSLELLEDRASLLFWKWIDAQSRGSTQALHKVAAPGFVAQVDQELQGLKARDEHKVFRECAVGSVETRRFERADGLDRVRVEVRWSARMGLGKRLEKLVAPPTLPQRWIFTLVRQQGARTNTDNGLSTNRCPQCHAPLTDSAAVTCDYCNTELASGKQDWVLLAAETYEAWIASAKASAPQLDAAALQRTLHTGSSSTPAPEVPEEGALTDPRERERLLYMMAALAAADGKVDRAERKLLELCARRWSVPWKQVELALEQGPSLLTQLVQRRTPEAEVFLRHLVELARVDGSIDHREQRLLELVAGRLQVGDALTRMLEKP